MRVPFFSSAESTSEQEEETLGAAPHTASLFMPWQGRNGAAAAAAGPPRPAPQPALVADRPSPPWPGGAALGLLARLAGVRGVIGVEVGLRPVGEPDLVGVIGVGLAAGQPPARPHAAPEGPPAPRDVPYVPQGTPADQERRFPEALPARLTLALPDVGHGSSGRPGRGLVDHDLD